MGQVSSKLRKTEDGFTYWCQGCGSSHAVKVAPGAWAFDGNLEAPTFSPSVLTTSGHFVPGHKDGSPCWCTYNAQHPDRPAPFECHRCHTFIRGGTVEFLLDCSHGLAGQSLPLPDLPAHMMDPGWPNPKNEEAAG